MSSEIEVTSQEVNRHCYAGFEHELVIARQIDRLHILIILAKSHFLTFLVDHHDEVRLVDDQRVAEVVLAAGVADAA